MQHSNPIKSDQRTNLLRTVTCALSLSAVFALVGFSSAQAADSDALRFRSATGSGSATGNRALSVQQFAQLKGMSVQDAGTHVLLQGPARVRLYANQSDAIINGQQVRMKDTVMKSGNSWILPSRVVTFLSSQIDAHSMARAQQHYPRARTSYPRAVPPASHGPTVGSSHWQPGSHVVRKGGRIFVYPPGTRPAHLASPATGGVTRRLRARAIPGSPTARNPISRERRVKPVSRAKDLKKGGAATPTSKSGKRKLRSMDDILGGNKWDCTKTFCPAEGDYASAISAPVSSKNWPPPSGVKERKWRWIVLHHSDDTSGNAAKYHKTHLEDNGWENGLGYHFVIGNGSLSGDGEVEVGPRWVTQIQGAHAKVPGNRYNEQGVGICLVGDFEHGTGKPSAKQFDSMVRLCRWLMQRYGISANDIMGHCDCCNTACPGKNFPWAEFRSRLSR